MPALAAIAFLAGLSGFGDFCQAAVAVHIDLTGDIVDNDPRITSSDALISGKFKKYRKTLARSGRRIVLDYEAPAWNSGVSFEEKRSVVHQLGLLWGASKVKLTDASASPDAAAARPPDKAMAQAARKIGGKLASSAIASPQLFYDGGAAGRGGAAGPALKNQAAHSQKKIAYRYEKKAPTYNLARAVVPAPRQWAGLPEIKIAGIIYNETANLLAKADDKSSEKQLYEARKMIALIADKRKGHGVARPARPSKAELRDQKTAMVWENVNEAATAAVSDMIRGKDCMDCRNFVMWPSDDPPAVAMKKPAKDPRMAADWPYDASDKISKVYGPFRNPTKVGDVPVGSNIYVFVYCGVR